MMARFLPHPHAPGVAASQTCAGTYCRFSGRCRTPCPVVWRGV